MNILIVEDYSPAAFLLEALCQGAGRLVEIAYTMQAARDKLWGKTKFHLVFLDLTLADSSPEDSIDYVKILKQKAKVVIVTGNENPALRKAAIDQGADGYLEKNNPNFADDVLAQLSVPAG